MENGFTRDRNERFLDQNNNGVGLLNTAFRPGRKTRSTPKHDFTRGLPESPHRMEQRILTMWFYNSHALYLFQEKNNLDIGCCWCTVHVRRLMVWDRELLQLGDLPAARVYIYYWLPQRKYQSSFNEEDLISTIEISKMIKTGLSGPCVGVQRVIWHCGRIVRRGGFATR
jgi:hypothetical protein